MLKNVTTKTTSVISNHKTDFMNYGMMTMMAVSMYAPIYAQAGINEMMGSIVGTVCDIFRLIGSVLLVWAIGQLVMAFKNEDADSKSRAMMVLVAAVLLVCVPSIYEALQSAAGGDVNMINKGNSLLN